MKKKITTRQITACAIIAALYAALTIATSSFAYGPIQFRIAEALCILPFFAPVTTWGLFVGCFIANIFSPVSSLDIIIGSMATLIACIWTSKIKNKYLAPLPPVIVNAVMIGAMLALVYTPDAPLAGFFVNAAQVGAGELAVMYVLGLPLLLYLNKSPKILNLITDND